MTASYDAVLNPEWRSTVQSCSGTACEHVRCADTGPVEATSVECVLRTVRRTPCSSKPSPHAGGALQCAEPGIRQCMHVLREGFQQYAHPAADADGGGLAQARRRQQRAVLGARLRLLRHAQHYRLGLGSKAVTHHHGHPCGLGMTGVGPVCPSESIQGRMIMYQRSSDIVTLLKETKGFTGVQPGRTCAGRGRHGRRRRRLSSRRTTAAGGCWPRPPCASRRRGCRGGPTAPPAARRAAGTGRAACKQRRGLIKRVCGGFSHKMGTDARVNAFWVVLAAGQVVPCQWNFLACQDATDL